MIRENLKKSHTLTISWRRPCKVSLNLALVGLLMWLNAGCQSTVNNLQVLPFMLEQILCKERLSIIEAFKEFGNIFIDQNITTKQVSNDATAKSVS